MVYLLDTNVFIEAKNRHYGFDFCPAFWDWIDQAYAAGIVFSIDAVRQELIDRGDDLSDWVRSRPKAFFIEPDLTTFASLRATSVWAEGAYKDAAVATFLQGADVYLVAQAHAQQHTVVTQEVPAPDSTKKIKIPDACRGMNVKYVTPFEMLRVEQARFVNGT